jgi:hypothetical protein
VESFLLCITVPPIIFGFTQAITVKDEPDCPKNEKAGGRTQSSTPSKLKAPPTLPVVQVAPYIVPSFPFPE